MAFSIKNPEADRLARELVEITGESLTEAVVLSLRERLGRHQPAKKRRMAGAELANLARTLSGAEVLDDRSPDQILGYDDNGLPT